MRVARGPALWVRRAVLAVVLVGAAVIPGRASSLGTQHCTGARCSAPGSVLWTHPLPGSWIVQPGVAGTVTSQDPAYAAAGGGIAVVGSDSTVTAFEGKTGELLWQWSITGVPAGSTIAGIRAFPGVVAVGMVPPPGQQAGRDEVILSAATGRQVRIYPAAPYGGAIAASRVSTVVVGPRTVTDYGNATGHVLWSRLIGRSEQTWRVSGQYVYITETGGGGSADGYRVTALRRINLRTGAEDILRPPRSAFPGTLTDAVNGVLLFSAAGGIWAYSGLDGQRLWNRQSAVLELTDAGHGIVYLASGNALTGVEVATGDTAGNAAISVAASMYSVTNGVALNLDQNQLGEAWGYSLTTRQVVWTSSALPWPHFFTDLSGLGGSASPGSGIVLLAICTDVGSTLTSGSSSACLQPKLAAVLV